jgi:hypothetical protein
MLVWKLFLSPHPFLDFRVLRHRNLVIGAAFGFGFGIVLQAATLIGGFVERTLEFTPTLGGGLDALRAVAIVIFVPIVTFAIAEKFLDVRAALILGLICTFVGFRAEVLATTAISDFGSFIVPFAGIGIGIAILYRALASVIFGSLPSQDLIMGLLVYKMSGVLGGAIASPVLVTLLDHRTAAHQADIAGSVALAAPAVRAFVDSTHGAVGCNARTRAADLFAGSARARCGKEIAPFRRFSPSHRRLRRRRSRSFPRERDVRHRVRLVDRRAQRDRRRTRPARSAARPVEPDCRRAHHAIGRAAGRDRPQRPAAAGIAFVQRSGATGSSVAVAGPGVPGHQAFIARASGTVQPMYTQVSPAAMPARMRRAARSTLTDSNGLASASVNHAYSAR